MPCPSAGIIELFFRFAAIGQLILVFAVYLRRPFNGMQASMLLVIACTVGYLLLRVPVAAVDDDPIRGVLLVLTDALPYAIWVTAMYWFQQGFRPSLWPRAVKFVIGLWILWHLYFFGFMQGEGLFHDLNHAVAILLMLHVVYVAISDLPDDLVDARRILRVVAAILVSLFMTYLAVAEFFSAMRDSRLADSLNAVAIFAAINLLAAFALRRTASPQEPPVVSSRVDEKKGDAIPSQLAHLDEKLKAFMDAGGYREPGLTIKSLAEQLSCPEHQLRRLINAGLGFRNFSAFLNSYRITKACELLTDTTRRSTPILTIALDLGYGSIGPFNRAFKTATGLTPTEYRQSFQNRQ